MYTVIAGAADQRYRTVPPSRVVVAGPPVSTLARALLAVTVKLTAPI